MPVASQFFFTALICEAKPLIQHWRMQKLSGNQPFPLYYNDDSILVISGIGAIAMGAAVAYTLAHHATTPTPILINLGIAGGFEYELGEIFAAHKIVNAETGKRFYPQFPPGNNLRRTHLITVARPEAQYADPSCLYDMEAAGFFEIATKFSSLELIHCIKIISDNQHNSYQNILEDWVTANISEQLPEIKRFVSTLAVSRQHIIRPEADILLPEILAAFHVTTANAILLNKLLQNWQLVYPDCAPDWQNQNLKNAKQLINWLQQQIDQAEFYL